MNRRQVVGVVVATATTAVLLASLVALTYGTRWGHEVYLFPYAIGASTLPLIAALATRRYRLVLPALLLSAGVLAFVAGVVDGSYCLQGTAREWYLAYDPARNVVQYGGSIGTCRAEPNAPVVLFGYALATVGSLQSLDALTARAWSPLDRSALPGLGRFTPTREPDTDKSN